MPLKSILDTIDDLSEESKALYAETKVGDKTVFVLDVDGIDDHPKVRGVITANRENVRKRDAYKAEADLLKARLEGLPEDFDADAYEALKAQADGKAPAKTDEQVAQVRQQLERKHQTEIGKKDERITSLEGTVRRILVDDGLTKALLEANVSKEFLPAAKALLKEKGVVKLSEEDGTFAATVETDMGPMSLGKYVGEWATGDEGKAFVAKPSGGDATGGTGGRDTTPNPWAKDTKNLTKQGEMLKANPGKARLLMKAAGLSDAEIDQRAPRAA